MVSRSVRLEVILGLKDQASKGLKKTESNFGKLNTRLKSMRLGLLAVSGALIGMGVLAVKSASDLEESFQAAEVTFKSAFGIVEDFAENTAGAFNLSQRAAFEYTAQLGAIFQASGLTADASAKMSVETVQLVADLASFKNLEIDVALQKIRSGLVGEVEPLRTVGVLLNAATVEAKAMALGLADANGQISEGAKVQARFAVIMDQLSDAQGDVARTSGSVANQMRNVKQQFEDLRAEIGTQLLPVVQGMLSGLGRMIAGFRNLAPEVQTVAIALAGVTFAVAAFGLALPPLIEGLRLLRTALTLIAKHPIIAVVIALTVVIGALVVAINKLNNSAADAARRGMAELAEATEKLQAAAGRAGQSLSETDAALEILHAQAIKSAQAIDGMTGAWRDFAKRMTEADFIPKVRGAIEKFNLTAEQIKPILKAANLEIADYNELMDLAGINTAKAAKALIELADVTTDSATVIVDANKSITNSIEDVIEAQQERVADAIRAQRLMAELDQSLRDSAKAALAGRAADEDAALQTRIDAIIDHQDKRFALDKALAAAQTKLAEERLAKDLRLFQFRADAADALAERNTAAFAAIRAAVAQLPSQIRVENIGGFALGGISPDFFRGFGRNLVLNPLTGGGFGINQAGERVPVGQQPTVVINVAGSVIAEADLRDIINTQLHDSAAGFIPGTEGL